MIFNKPIVPLFRRTKQLEDKIDAFLDCIADAGMLFQRAFKGYLEEGPGEAFEEAVKLVHEYEVRADKLRRSIKAELYEQTLIPDLRADVLSLIEDMDHLMGLYQSDFFRVSIESPDIPEAYHKGFNDLIEAVVQTVDHTVMAVRAFFRDIESVPNHTQKAMFYETEADKIVTRMLREIFRSDLPKVEMFHLRYFIERIDALANEAEDVVDSLAIYTIKRSN